MTLSYPRPDKVVKRSAPRRRDLLKIRRRQNNFPRDIASSTTHDRSSSYELRPKTLTQNLALFRPGLGFVPFKEPNPISLAPATEFKTYENIHLSKGTQLVGIEITSTMKATHEEVLKATSTLEAYSNTKRGIGRQVVGQLVRADAMPRMMAGELHHNTMEADGDQVIGLCFE